MSASKIIPNPDPPFFDGIPMSFANVGMTIVMAGWFLTLFVGPFLGIKLAFTIFTVTSVIGWPLFGIGFVLVCIFPKRKPRKP
jgi:hypothetical protein